MITWPMVLHIALARALTGNKWTQHFSRLRHSPGLQETWVQVPPGSSFSQLIVQVTK